MIRAQPESVSGPLSPSPRWERWAVALILAAFIAVAFHAVGNFATEGQDFYAHSKYTRELLAHPETWFVENSTSRPLLYWIGALCIRIVGSLRGFQLASIVFTLAGAAALALLHDASRRLIRSPLIRVVGTAFVAFLPLTVITTVVYAADTVASLPFVLAGWCLVRSLEAVADREALVNAALGGLALVLGDFARATFLVLSAAVVFLVLALWRAGRLPRKRGYAVLALCAVLPSLVGGLLAVEAARQFSGQKPFHQFNWHGTGRLTLRNLFLLKPSDTRIFDAPGYFDPDHAVLMPNGFSYPALLHLGIFTDVLDYAQNDRRMIPRPDPQWSASRWSVQLGTFFSVGAFVTVLVFWAKTLKAFAWKGPMPSAAALTWASFAMAWYVPIVGSLPFVYHVNTWGYWLPRLVMPALWIFFFSLFAAIDRLPGRWQGRCAALLAAAVFILSAAEIRSIWY